MLHLPSPRIISIDLLRGFFLIVIIIDHLGRFPSGFELLTGRGELWITAAEGFFFVSGMMVGVTRAAKIKRRGFRPIWLSLWRRSAILYLWSVGLTFLCLGWAWWLGWAPKGGLTGSHDLVEIGRETVLLHYAYGWADFLPRYVIFLFWSPLAAWLLHKNWWWVILLGSGGLWLMSRHDFTLSWQILFFTGMMAGYYLPWLEWRMAHLPEEYSNIFLRGSILVGIFVLFLSATLVFMPPLLQPLSASGALFGPSRMTQERVQSLAQAFNPHFISDGVSGLRYVLFLLYFWSAYALVRRHEQFLQEKFGPLLLPLGRASLLTYITHAVVLFGVATVVHQNLTPQLNFILTTTVLLSIWVIVRFGPIGWSRLTVLRRTLESQTPLPAYLHLTLLRQTHEAVHYQRSDI